MNTVRRLYFYIMALVSAEVVIWGVVNLLRTVALRRSADSREALATGLSLLLVGIPIFLLHWRVVQRDAARDPEERASRVRAVFLYASLSATLGPIVYAVMAVINRFLGGMLALETYRFWFGGDGIAADNLIALAINTAAFAFFWWVTRKDWQADTPEHFLDETRRLYRYAWFVIGLILALSGTVSLLRYGISLPSGVTPGMSAALAGGAAMLLVGAPLLGFFWSTIQASLASPVERRSLLRLVVLYLISLFGVLGVLSGLAPLISSIIQWLARKPYSFVEFLNENSGPVGAALPMGAMWWYFGGVLNREVNAISDQPRREALRRLYYYILSAFGLGAVYFGLISLLNVFSRILFERESVFASFRSDLGNALAALLVGVPLWLAAWRLMQQEAARRDESGDHARRSVIRKAYLYLVLFLMVIGVMVFAGQIVYNLLNAVLIGGRTSLAQEMAFLVLALAADSALLVYHWRVLRQDGRVAQQTMGNLHAAYPTLVFVEGNEPDSEQFADALLALLPRAAPRMPVAVHRVERGAPDEPMLGAKAILLSSRLVMNPPESLRLWLDEFRGQRIILPTPESGWRWLGLGEKRPQELAREAAQTLRQMAEGEILRSSAPLNAWSVAGLAFGGFFLLWVILLVFGMIVGSSF